MKIGFVTALASAVILLWPAPAVAQSDETSAACNRAWLASDWPSTVAECESVAESRTMKRDHYVSDSEAPGIPGQLMMDASDLAGIEALSAGEALARVAFAYGKLKRTHLALTSQQNALELLNFAKSHVPFGPVRQKVTDVLQLLQSDDFFKTAADSDALSSI